MGLSIDSTQFLVQARKAGVSFQETLTLGRQMMLVSSERMEKILREHGFWPPPGGSAQFYEEMAKTPWRFEIFARALGAENVSSADASSYEGATLIHDLNLAIPPAWEERFDVVIDGGTIEHVFNFPVAISNCMKLVKVGGHVILFTPANNYFGHGFYQFSPELFYRVFNADNGFEVRRMVALVDNVGIGSLFGLKYLFPITGPWYEVKDPDKIKKRVTLINDKSVILMVLARKLSKAAILQKPPQQSDYVPQWQEGVNQNPLSQSATGNRIVARLKQALPESVCKEWLPKIAALIDPFRFAKFRRENSFKSKELYHRTKKRG